MSESSVATMRATGHGDTSTGTVSVLASRRAVSSGKRLKASGVAVNVAGPPGAVGPPSHETAAARRAATKGWGRRPGRRRVPKRVVPGRGGRKARPVGYRPAVRTRSSSNQLSTTLTGIASGRSSGMISTKRSPSGVTS